MPVCPKNISFPTKDNQIWDMFCTQDIKSNRIFQPGKGMTLGGIAETCSLVSAM